MSPSLSLVALATLPGAGVQEVFGSLLRGDKLNLCQVDLVFLRY